LPLASIFAFSNIPSFDKNFANGLKEWWERVYDPGKLGIDSSRSLKENIRAMFYPDPYGTGGGGIIRNMIQIIAAWFFVAMIMFTGIQFIWFADDSKKITEAKNSILYVSYGGFLIFWSAYLVWLINFEWGGGSRELIENLQNNILVNIITFMKGITFFLAIIMMFWYGTQIIQALDAEDKRKKGISWVINVLSALVFIKLLDFVYYIAQQQDFKSRVTSLLVDVSKVVWYTLGGLMFLYLIYAWWLMIMSNGEDDGYKKATNTLKTLFMVALIIFLFLMIIYQLVNDLG
jgi:hypothetical protein